MAVRICRPATAALAFLTLAGIFLFGVDAECKIMMTVRSMTNTPFKIRVKIPSVNAETDEVLFTRKGQQQQVKIAGVNCMDKPWIFRTQKQDERGRWVPAKQGTAKLHGMGHMTVTVDDTLMPMIMDLFAVACSESSICG